MTTPLPGTLRAYRVATTVLSPLAGPFLRWRVSKGKEDPARLRERFGHPSRPRPPGPLVWAHGASIGETQALLPLVEALARRGIHVLVTSGTRTSAEILAARLPPGALHQYLPLDIPRFVRRFLVQWQPDLALFAESEIWPTTLIELGERRIPLALVNGRMSARSFDGWRRAPGTVRALFSRFTVCLAQTEADAERFAALGAPVTATAGNLKYDVPALPADPASVEALAARIAGRPVWMAASTHPGEEEIVVATHLALRQRIPGLLTLVAPRHPARGDEIADYVFSAGLGLTRRSRGEPAGAPDIHLVDTVGELGLFYRIAPLVLMGGSLVPHGGQNPIEPARLGAAVLHGPHVANFTDVYRIFDEAGASIPITEDDLAARAGELLSRPATMRAMASRGAKAVAGLGGAVATTLEALEPYLPAAPA